MRLRRRRRPQRDHADIVPPGEYLAKAAEYRSGRAVGSGTPYHRLTFEVHSTTDGQPVSGHADFNLWVTPRTGFVNANKIEELLGSARRNDDGEYKGNLKRDLRSAIGGWWTIKVTAWTSKHGTTHRDIDRTAPADPPEGGESGDPLG